MLLTSNFSFSHSVFKRLVLQTGKNQSLFRKGLNKNVQLSLCCLNGFFYHDVKIILKSWSGQVRWLLSEVKVDFTSQIARGCRNYGYADTMILRSILQPREMENLSEKKKMTKPNHIVWSIDLSSANVLILVLDNDFVVEWKRYRFTVKDILYLYKNDDWFTVVFNLEQ